MQYNGPEALIKPCHDVDFGLFNYLLRQYQNANVRNENRDTILHLLAHQHNMNVANLKHILNELIKYHIDLNAQNKEGNTPLHIALEKNLPLAILILNSGASPFIKNDRQQSALDLINNSYIIQEILLNCVFIPCVVESIQFKQIENEIKQNKLDKFKKFTLQHFDINARNSDGNSLGHIAAIHRMDFTILQEFKLHGADFKNLRNNENKSVFDLVHSNYPFIIFEILFANNKNHLITPTFPIQSKELISSPAQTSIDPKLKDKQTEDLMQSLIFHDFNKFFDLLSQGCDINAQKDGMGVLHFLAIISKDQIKAPVKKNENKESFEFSRATNRYGYTSLKELFKYFLKFKIDLNMKNIVGLTPLHLAVLNNYIELAVVLIQTGAAPNLADHFNKTPLDYAREIENKDFILLLEPKLQNSPPKKINSDFINKANLDSSQLSDSELEFSEVDITSLVAVNLEVFDKLVEAIRQQDFLTLTTLLKLPSSSSLTKNGDNLLHFLCQYHDEGHLRLDYLTLNKIFDSLPKDKNFLECLNSKEMTPLHSAILANYPDMVAALLKNGASPLIESDHSDSPLTFAQNLPQEQQNNLIIELLENPESVHLIMMREIMLPAKALLNRGPAQPLSHQLSCELVHFNAVREPIAQTLKTILGRFETEFHLLSQQRNISPNKKNQKRIKNLSKKMQKLRLSIAFCYLIEKSIGTIEGFSIFDANKVNGIIDFINSIIAVKHYNYEDLPQELDLSHCYLSRLTEHTLNLIRLKIHRQFNHTKLWEEVGQFYKLILNNNLFSDFPVDLVKQIPHLQLLDFSYNYLNQFPAPLYEAYKLNTLNLKHNNIADILPDINQLTALTDLNLSENSLQKEIKLSLRLQKLNLTKNHSSLLVEEKSPHRMDMKNINKIFNTLVPSFEHFRIKPKSLSKSKKKSKKQKNKKG